MKRHMFLVGVTTIVFVMIVIGFYMSYNFYRSSSVPLTTTCQGVTTPSPPNTIIECSKTFYFSGVTPTTELYPFWSDVVWATVAWESSWIIIDSVVIDTYAWILPAQNIYCRIMLGNSYYPDLIAGPYGAFGPAQAAQAGAVTIHSEHKFESGHGSIFPPASEVQLPNAPRLDIHFTCVPSSGVNYEGHVTYFYHLWRQ